MSFIKAVSKVGFGFFLVFCKNSDALSSSLYLVKPHLEYCVYIRSSAQERCAAVGVSSEEATDAQRAGAPLLRRQVEGVGIVCIGEEELLGRP